MLMLSRTPEAGEGSGSVNRMQEYLTGLSEQYSAFQTLMGQQAAIQQLQVTIIIIIIIVKPYPQILSPQNTRPNPNQVQ